MQPSIVHQAVGPAVAAPPEANLAAGVVGGLVVLLLVGVALIMLLIRHYRSECRQLRERNRQLSLENDGWHEDFALQTGALSALRQSPAGRCCSPIGTPAEAS